MLVNRVHRAYGEEELTESDIGLLDRVSASLLDGRSLSERVDAALQDARALASADAEALRLLDGSNERRRDVPHMNRDLHSIDDLAAFAQALR
jgi:hypothetical protein